jgi:hypothetical protein
MGIFRHDLAQPELPPGIVQDDQPGASADRWVACDRCSVAQAQVEVVTEAGPVFLCHHHHTEHSDAIVAAGHLTRAWPAPQAAGPG